MRREQILYYLKNIRQKDHKSVAAFTAAFRVLLLRLNEPLPEYIKIDYYLDGLKYETQKHTRAQIATFTEAEKTLANVIAIALSFDQTYQHSHLIQHPSTTRTKTYHQSTRQNLYQPRQEKYHSLPSRPRHMTPTTNNNSTVPMEIDNLDSNMIETYRKEGRCYKCSGIGHIARDCKTKNPRNLSRCGNYSQERSTSSRENSETAPLNSNRQ